MRAWLYDHLTTDEALMAYIGATPETITGRVRPREASETINIEPPFLIYGLGNATNEDLAEADDHQAERQFFQVWVHDRGGSYDRIDDIIEIVKARLRNASDPASKVMQVRYLETSAEFGNETYNTIFRYIRFQAIIGSSKGVTA